MFSDSVLINRRNVSSDVKSKVTACEQFFLMEVECRITAAAMEEHHIKDINEMPSKSCMSYNLVTRTEKRDFQYNVAALVVDKYVLQCSKLETLLKKTKRRRISKPYNVLE